MQSEVKHAAVEVDGALGVQLLQNPVQSYKSSGAAHTSTDTHKHICVSSRRTKFMPFDLLSNSCTSSLTLFWSSGRLPTVHHCGTSGWRAVYIVPDCPGKLDQGLCAVRDPMVRPYGVVEVTQDSGVTAAALL